MIWKALIVGRIFWRFDLVICFDVSLLLLQVGLNMVNLCVCVSKGSVFGYECSTTCACVCVCVCEERERERERELLFMWVLLLKMSLYVCCRCLDNKWRRFTTQDTGSNKFDNFVTKIFRFSFPYKKCSLETKKQLQFTYVGKMKSKCSRFN